MSKKPKGSKKQPPISLYTVSSDQTKMFPVPEDEELPSQPLHSEGKKAEIVKKGNSPLEATFTSSPNRRGSQTEDGTDKGTQSVPGEKLKKKKKSTDYTALEFISSSSQTNSVDMEEGPKEVDLEHIPEDEKILTSLICLLFEVFKPLWSLAATYYYYWSGLYTALYTMIIVLLVSAFCSHFVYFISRNSPIRKIWKTSKFLSLVCAIPFALAPVLALCNCLFALKEARSRMYERPWTNTLTIFMVESLTLSFPMCVLQMCLMLENSIPFPSIPGLAMIFATTMLSVDITFTRVRHDSHKRCDRFGEKYERYGRYIYIWANKVLWFCSYAIVIVSLRICFPEQIHVATAVAIAALFLVYESMVMTAVIPFFQRVASSMVGVLYIFPQFVTLFTLILWVNIDKTVYDTAIGSFTLGVIFWGECIVLTGWVFDRALGKEPDFLPVYPHFTGDVFSYCCQ